MTRVRTFVVVTAFLQTQLLPAQPPANYPMPAPRPAPLDPNANEGALGAPQPSELAKQLAKSFLNIDLHSVDDTGNHKPAALAGLTALQRLYEEYPNLDRKEAQKVAGAVYKAIDSHLNDPTKEVSDLAEAADKSLESMLSVLEIGATKNISPSQIYGLLKNSIIIPLKLTEQRRRDEMRAYGEGSFKGSYDSLDFNWLNRTSFNRMLENPKYLSAVSLYLEKWNRVPLMDKTFDLKNPALAQFHIQGPGVGWIGQLGVEASRPQPGTRPSAAGGKPAVAPTTEDRPVSMQFMEDVAKRLVSTQRHLAQKGVYDPKGSSKAALSPEEAKKKLEQIRSDMAPARAAVSIFKALAGSDRDAQIAGAIMEATVDVATTTIALLGQAIGSGAAVGGYVGAVVGLFVALVQILGSGPSLNEILLKEVRQLRQAIAQVLNTLAGQNNLLHFQFGEMRELINRRFDAIESLFSLRLEKLENLQRQTHETLRSLAFKIVEKEQNTRYANRQKEITELSKNYVMRAHRTQSAEAYAASMTYLLLCATQTSRGVDWTGTPNPFSRAGKPDDLSEMNTRLAQELRGEDPRDQINVLYEAQTRLIGKEPERSEVLKDVVLVTDALSPVANPRLWASCAKEYLDSAKSNPGFYERFDPDLRNLSAVIDTGYRFQLANARLTPTKPGGGRDMACVLKIVDNYQAQIGNVQAALESVRVEGHKKLKGLDPMKGLLDHSVAVPIERILDEGKIRPCPGANWPKGQDWEFPIDEKKLEEYAKLIPQEAALAVHLDLGELRFCFDSVGFSDQQTVYDYYSYDTRDRIRMGTPTMILRLELVPSKGKPRLVGRWKVEANAQFEVSREQQRVVFPVHSYAPSGSFSESVQILRYLDKDKFSESHPKDSDQVKGVRQWRRGRWDQGKFIATDVTKVVPIQWNGSVENGLEHRTLIERDPKPKAKSDLPNRFEAEERARLEVLERDKEEDSDKKYEFTLVGPTEETIRRARLLLVRDVLEPIREEARTERNKDLLQLAINREGVLRVPSEALDGARQFLVASIWQSMGSALEKDPGFVQELAELPDSEALGKAIQKDAKVLAVKEGLQNTIALATEQKIKALRSRLQILGEQKDLGWGHSSVADLMQQLEAQFILKAAKQKAIRTPESLHR